MMPKVFKAERLSLCVIFAIEINILCNKWVTEHYNTDIMDHSLRTNYF